MKIFFKNCRVHETANCKGPWVNTATILYDGKEMVIDRDTTEYSVFPDGSCQMEWLNVYAWDGETQDYSLDPVKCGKMVSYEIEDDADKEYIFEIDMCAVSFL